MQARKQLLSTITLFFFVQYCTGQLSPYERWIEDSKQAQRNREREEKKREAKSIEWQRTVAENAKIPAKRYGTMKFFTGDERGGEVRTGYLISFTSPRDINGQIAGLPGIILASWNEKYEAWEKISVNVYGSQAKQTSYGVYYGYSIGGFIREETLKPYYENPDKYHSIEERLTALEDYLSGKKSLAQIKKEKQDIIDYTNFLKNAPPGQLIDIKTGLSDKVKTIKAKKLNVQSSKEIYLVEISKDDYNHGVVYKIPLSNNNDFIGQVFMNYTKLEPMPYYYWGGWGSSITINGLLKLSALVEEKLQLITPVESKQKIKEYDNKMIKANLEGAARLKKAKEEEFIRNEEIRKEAERRASVLNSETKAAKKYSLVSFMIRDSYSYNPFPEFKGYKLNIKSKDSIFILTQENLFYSLGNGDISVAVLNTKINTFAERYVFYLKESFKELRTSLTNKETRHLFLEIFDSLVADQVYKRKLSAPEQLKYENKRKNFLNELIAKANKQIEDLTNQKNTRSESQFSIIATPGETYLGDYEIINGEKKPSGLGIIEKNGTTIYKSNCRDSLPGTTCMACNESGHIQTMEISHEGVIKFSGYDIKIYPDGFLQYKGKYLITKNGKVYIGTLNDIKNQGFAELHLPNGSIFSGRFENGLYQGPGLYYDIDGTKYEGAFSNGMKNGTGILAATIPSASPGRLPTFYTSENYLNDVKQKTKNNILKDKEDGYTSYTEKSVFGFDTPDTVYYDYIVMRGQQDDRIQIKTKKFIRTKFISINDKPVNGIQFYRTDIYRYRSGITEMPGNTYKNYLDNKEYTDNIIIYPNNDIYIGQTMRSRPGFETESFKAGKGVYLYENGDIYIGRFCDDKRCAGTGTMIFKNGDICVGQFSQGKMTGKFNYISKSSKEKFSGFYNDGVRDGEGIIYSADGTSKNVLYKNGVLQQ